MWHKHGCGYCLLLYCCGTGGSAETHLVYKHHTEHLTNDTQGGDFDVGNDLRM